MADLTIENIIKIIIGLVVVVVVAIALYFFFTNRVIDLFKNFGVNNTGKILMSLLR